MKKLLLIFLIPFVIKAQLLTLFSDEPYQYIDGAYYVSTNGNDSNDGLSIANAFLTIGHAELTAPIGSTIYVMGGTYNESYTSGYAFYLGRGHTWIGRHNPILTTDGTGYILLVRDRETSFDGFKFNAQNNSVVIRIYSNSPNITMSNIEVYGVFSGQALTIENADTNIFNNIYVHDFNTPSQAVLLGGTSVNTFNGLRIANTSTSAYAIAVTSTNDNVISDLSLANVEFANYVIAPNTNSKLSIINSNISYTGTKSLIFTTSAASINISNNTINISSDYTSDLFRITCPSITIANNRITQTLPSETSDIFVLNGSGSVTSNTITAYGYSAVPIVLNNTSEGQFIINSNTIYDRLQEQYSISLGTESSTAYDDMLNGSLITNNTVYGLGYYYPDSTAITHSIFIGHNDSVNVIYNKIYGGGYGLVYKNTGGVSTNGLVAYNLFVNCRIGMRIKGIANLDIFNNTIYSDRGNSIAGISISDNDGVGAGSVNSNIKNNNLYTSANVDNYSSFNITDNDTSGLEIDYNNIINLANTYHNFMNGYTTVTTYSAYTALGWDANGLNEDPLFTSSSDFSLQATSPLINEGTDVGLTQDILGNSINGAVDIGAYEKQ